MNIVIVFINIGLAALMQPTGAALFEIGSRESEYADALLQYLFDVDGRSAMDSDTIQKAHETTAISKDVLTPLFTFFLQSAQNGKIKKGGSIDFIKKIILTSKNVSTFLSFLLLRNIKGGTMLNEQGFGKTILKKYCNFQVLSDWRGAISPGSMVAAIAKYETNKEEFFNQLFKPAP